LNPLIEILRSSPDRVWKVWVDRGSRNQRINEIISLARAGHIPVHFVPRVTLDRMSRRHQGIVADVSSRGFVPLESLLEASPRSFLVLLDEVEDPQNLGAVIRTAESAGADGIILPERRSAGLTETVAAVSAGALEHIPVARVKNLVRTMEELKKRGIWLVGAEADAKEKWHDFDYTLPVGLVMGSEGKGLRPLVRKTCDKVLSLPLRGRVSSLNVSSAAAVFLYEVVRQREQKQDSVE